MKACPNCDGTGQWECECCSGAGGCSCRGQAVPMGDCRVCHGTGQLPDDDSGVNYSANIDMIRGLHFIGTGGRDTRDLWPNRGGYGGTE